MLPPPRDAAARRLWRALKDLATGREAPPPPRTLAQDASLDRADARIAVGDPSGATGEIEGVLAQRPFDHRALALQARVRSNAPIRGRSERTEDLVADARAALRVATPVGTGAPILLAFFPHSKANPFQALLYSRTLEHGVAALPLRKYADADLLLPFIAEGVQVVLHLHWVNVVLKGVTDVAEAEERVTDFLAWLDHFLENGGRLVWTIHNVLPHDAALPSVEARLRQALADRAAMIHVLAAETLAAIADHFTIDPTRVLHVPLPGFQGAYADTVSPAAARLALGIEPDEVAYLMLGGLRPYKGFDVLLDAWRLVRDDPTRRTLVVAGKPDGSPATAASIVRAMADPTIHLHARMVPAEDIQLFLRAADIGVLPYIQTLNSAALMLDATFGLPVVAPAVPGIAELVSRSMAETFTPGDIDSLATALRQAERLVTPAARAAARALADAHEPGDLSTQFSRGLMARLADAKAS